MTGSFDRLRLALADRVKNAGFHSVISRYCLGTTEELAPISAAGDPLGRG
jgi:hypothetical protein